MISLLVNRSSSTLQIIISPKIPTFIIKNNNYYNNNNDNNNKGTINAINKINILIIMVVQNNFWKVTDSQNCNKKF